ncbi:MAG TPA: D-alanyl-D-alanine carboxypeptidase/D-alanyl-D-alanine-endopeptidase [Tepidisphaeraceae bacterium]|nr:D-alanyl-D-alanine carboxypeptidase/D-alanyl-D-alanine-endopeptidase [Tepidisphaeraceae bacterium]
MKLAVQLGCILFAAVAATCRADLASDVNLVLQDKLLQRASVGIEMVRLGGADGQAAEVYQHNARAALTPASNLKLATTSAAIDHLGADFKFRTVLYLHDGELVLVGDGDPSFGDAEYLKRVGWKPTTVYESWADRLRKLNIASVRNIIVDDSVFDENFMHPHWPTNQIDHWYVAELGGLNFNINCIDFLIDASVPGRVQFSTNPRTDYVKVDNSCVAGANAVQLGRKLGTNEIILRGEASRAVPGPFQETIHDPPLYAGTVLADTFESLGIHVTGSVQRNRTMRQQKLKGTAAAWKVVGIHETPLAVALARANKDSINLYAECLCKRLGHEVSEQPGSWENGTAAVGEFLKRVGAGATEFHLDDGSGLSKQNLISPHALARVLEYDFNSKNHDAFLASLSVSGVDGTLEERFRGTDLRRRVIGKSGFVEGVSCLSGLLHARDGQWYAFSIMMNGIPYKSNTLAKTLQEKIVRALDAHTSTASARG